MNLARPLLLFNDECGVCRRIAGWVATAGTRHGRAATLDERAIGDDPEALRLLDPDLDIWDAYATIHLLMPDGSVRLGGEAVAEVLRRLPSTRWLARSFVFSVLGWRPFQAVLNVAYTVLADVRPLLGCESCGLPSRWVRPFVAAFKWARGLLPTASRAPPWQALRTAAAPFPRRDRVRADLPTGAVAVLLLSAAACHARAPC